MNDSIEIIKKELLKRKEKLAENIPSDIEYREDISKELGFNFFVKRDDILGKYGGNKVRKLEFLFPKINTKNVFMFGPTGSHHLIANLIYGKDRFDFTTFIFPTYLYKTGDEVIKKKTELVKRQSKRFIFVPNIAVAFAVSFVLSKIQRAFLIPPGSTSAESSLGFVLSAIEIYEDVRKQKIPEPDLIFLPCGTGGTAAGLSVGIALCGLKTTLMAIQVVKTCRKFILKKICDRIFHEMEKILKTEQSEIKKHLKFEILSDFIGRGYGYPTKDGYEAMKFFRRFNIDSEPTYTSKTLSALIKLKEKLKGKNIIFYYTLNTLNILK